MTNRYNRHRKRAKEEGERDPNAMADQRNNYQQNKEDDQNGDENFHASQLGRVRLSATEATLEPDTGTAPVRYKSRRTILQFHVVRKFFVTGVGGPAGAWICCCYFV